MMYRFDESGVEHVSCQSTSELDDDSSVWCLADDAPTATIYDVKDWMIVHASSPNTEQYKHWMKHTGAALFVMDLWSWSDLVFIW
jgi:hypothetical protein